jgi:hypothetical protein
MKIKLPLFNFARTSFFLVLLFFATSNARSGSPEDYVLTVPTRFGSIIALKDKDDPCGCSGWIQFGSNRIKVSSGADSFYASNEGVFPMKEGDVVIVSTPVGGKMPWQHYVILVNNGLFVELSPEGFGTEDWTFKVRRNGNELLFDLGFKDGKRKTAVYRHGMLYTGVDVVGTPTTVPKDRCAGILNNVIDCGHLVRERTPHDCSQNSIQESLPMYITRSLFTDANLPIFKEDNFYTVCASICETGKYDSRATRKLLCGY